jgi:hypothetical protein
VRSDKEVNMTRYKKTRVALINVALIACVVLGLELYCRVKYPCNPAERHSPWAFVPGIGTGYKPHDTVRATNRFDYCVDQKSNSLGFLDYEPPRWEDIKDKPKIAIVGDSMVEATQVPLGDKMQTVLRQSLARELGVDASVVAWGISGLGQVQELAMFERFGLALHPDVVLVIIVPNDLKNNSWLVQAVDDGVSPDTPYNVEIRPASLKDPRHVNDWVTIEPVPIRDVVRLPAAPDAAPPDPLRRWLLNNSVLYAYLLHLATANFSVVSDILSPRGSDFDLLGYYVDEVQKKNPELTPLLEGWPRNGSGDYVSPWNAFEAKSWPLAFDLTVRATEHVMDQWVDLAKREKFKLVAMMKADFTGLNGQIGIWERVLRERNIPIISQIEFYKAKGYARNDEHFLRDGHWTAQGHRWTAESFLEFLKAHPDWLTPANAGGSQALSAK